MAMDFVTNADPFAQTDPFVADDGVFAGGGNNCAEWVADDALLAAFAEQLRPQRQPVPSSSVPVFTERLSGDLVATVIRVEVDHRVAYQVYCVQGVDWCLTGYFGLFCDALGELNTWRRYIAAGGSLDAWKIAYPDGVRPDRSSVVAR